MHSGLGGGAPSALACCDISFLFLTLAHTRLTSSSLPNLFRATCFNLNPNPENKPPKGSRLPVTDQDACKTRYPPTSSHTGRRRCTARYSVSTFSCKIIRVSPHPHHW